jgi:hypothetical protein
MGDPLSRGKKLLDLIKTSPTLPVLPTDDGSGGPVIIISGNGNNTTIVIN